MLGEAIAPLLAKLLWVKILRHIPGGESELRFVDRMSCIQKESARSKLYKQKKSKRLFTKNYCKDAGNC